MSAAPPPGVPPAPRCPLPRAEIIERYFMEHRARLIDIAAFLDRLDRAADGAGGPPETGEDEDPRIAAFRAAVAILGEAAPGRARRVLERFSDPTTEPIASAAGLKGALGAYPGPPGASGGGGAA